MAAIVERERLVADGTGARADSAFGALKCDAALWVELEHTHVHGAPRHFCQRAGLAGRRTGHVLTDDAGPHRGVDVWRAGREPAAVRRRLENRVHGADVDAIAAARAGRDERNLGRGAGRPEPALRRDLALGALGDLVEQPADRAL